MAEMDSGFDEFDELLGHVSEVACHRTSQARGKRAKLRGLIRWLGGFEFGF